VLCGRFATHSEYHGGDARSLGGPECSESSRGGQPHRPGEPSRACVEPVADAPAGLLVNLMAAPRHEVLGYCGEVCRGFTALR
jgi:hypothetical protein